MIDYDYDDEVDDVSASGIDNHQLSD